MRGRRPRSPALPDERRRGAGWQRIAKGLVVPAHGEGLGGRRGVVGQQHDRAVSILEGHVVDRMRAVAGRAPAAIPGASVPRDKGRRGDVVGAGVYELTGLSELIVITRVRDGAA